MHRCSIHAALGNPNVHCLANSLVRQYASTTETTSRDPTPVPSKPRRFKPRSNSKDRKESDNTAFHESRKHSSTPRNPSRNAKTIAAPATLTAPPPEPAFRAHSVWKGASIWVSRKPRRPQEPQEDSISSLHPLLLRDKQGPGEWEPTPPKGVDNMPLKRLLLTNRASADQALQAMAEPREDAMMTVSDDSDWIEMTFTPGTFVETRKNEIYLTAVVLGEVIEDQRWRVLSLSRTGEVFVHLREDVQFTVPGFVSSDLAARCGHERITGDPKHINARVEVLKKLKQFNMNVEASYNTDEWMRQRTVNFYKETRSADPIRWAKTTVKHATHLMWQQPKYFHYYAMHKYLMGNPLYFVATINCLTSQTFHVRPRRDVEEIETVEKWIADHRRNKDGQLTRFIMKAKQVIDRYWTKGNKNTSGPVSQEPAEHTWDEEDQVFLRFLLRSLAPVRSVQRDPYDLTKVNLMKLLYPKIYNVTDVATFQCLKELGVVAPWHDPFESLHHANPSGDFYTPDPYIKEGEEIVKRTSQNKAVAGSVLGPEDLYPVDPLDSVRHDFGDVSVFVIDDAKAEELDDGVSVERISSEPDKYWVHTHIADPTSVLHPGHVLSLRARERGATLYFRQKTFPLFPQSLVHDPSHGLSLGTRSSAGLGDRTLTFSTKLDMQGNILDYKVRAGIIRNVRKITYSRCDQLLGLDPIVRTFPFGRTFEEAPEPPATFTDGEIGDLKLLLQLMNQQVEQRFAANIFNLDLDRASVDVLTASDSVRIQSLSMGGSRFNGFPEMEYSVANSANMDQGSRMIVSEMMKLASRVASRVALEHDLPLVRRALDPIVPLSDNATKAMLRARSPNGYIPMHKFMNHTAMTPASVYTLEPRKHCGVGIPEGQGYSRVTSPLRRFEDLVVHWQLHHVLLGPNAPARYPFSLSEMERLCIDITTVDKTNRKLHMTDEFFHNLLFMKRWMEETEKGVLRPHDDPLAGTLTAYKLSSAKRGILNNMYTCGVAIPKLGVKAHLVDLKPNCQEVPLSAPLRVKVKNIDLAVNKLALQVVLAK